MSDSKKRGQPKVSPCARCGILRNVGRPAVVLCVDCRYVLSESEKRAWMEAA